MPKLYEYFGLAVLFYSNEHAPIHVHGRFQDLESKAEIIMENGAISHINFVDIKGKNPLKGKELERFKALVETHKKEIVDKWVDFFVYNKTFKPQIITKEIK